MSLKDLAPNPNSIKLAKVQSPKFISKTCIPLTASDEVGAKEAMRLAWGYTTCKRLLLRSEPLKGVTPGLSPFSLL